MNKTDLLDRFARDGESRLLLARVLDQTDLNDAAGRLIARTVLNLLNERRAAPDTEE